MQSLGHPPNTQTCNYTYDDLARVASGNCGSVWSQTFSYDAFGNLAKAGSESFNPGYTVNNQMMTGASYDAMGDVLSDSLHSYAWNSDTRPTTIDTVTVTYDAFGRMVEQTKAGVSTEMEYSPTGFLMALLKGQSEVKLFMPLPGGTEQVWQTGGAASPYYRHADWLGSSRFASTQSRTMYNDLAYAPFGETYAAAGSTGVTDISFAGNDEDTTTNLYDAQFREYGIQGRWPSPDPAGVAAANPANPQSWNRYAYVMNNPLSFFDPSGLDCWLTGLYFPVPCPDVTSITVNGSPFNFVGAAGNGSSRLANPIEIFMGGPKGGGSGGGNNGPVLTNHNPNQLANLTPGCPSDPGMALHSGGISISGTAGAGVGSGGGSVATGSLGIVGGQGASAVGTASGGAMTSAGSYTGGSPNQSPGARAYGAYIGASLSATFSNGQPGQLRGTFRSYNVDVGLGSISFAFQFACSGFVCQGSISPGIGPGIGFLVTTMATNTAVTTNQCK